MSTKRGKGRSRTKGRGTNGGSVTVTMSQMYADPYRGSSKGRLHRGVPNCLEATLCYDEVVTCTPATGSTAGNSYRLNDLFDPRVESGGHQPTFFDQLMSLYGTFVVLESEILLSANTPGYSESSGTTTANTNTPLLAIIAPYGTGTIPSAATSDLLEWPGVQSRPLSAFQAKQVRQHFILYRMFGLRSLSAMRNNPDYWGNSGASPAVQWQAFCGIGSLTGTGLATVVSVRVMYKAIFFNPRFPSISDPRPVCVATSSFTHGDEEPGSDREASSNKDADTSQQSRAPRAELFEIRRQVLSKPSATMGFKYNSVSLRTGDDADGSVDPLAALSEMYL